MQLWTPQLEIRSIERRVHIVGASQAVWVGKLSKDLCEKNYI